MTLSPHWFAPGHDESDLPYKMRGQTQLANYNCNFTGSTLAFLLVLPRS